MSCVCSFHPSSRVTNFVSVFEYRRSRPRLEPNSPTTALTFFRACLPVLNLELVAVQTEDLSLRMVSIFESFSLISI